MINTKQQPSVDRRSFLKSTALAGGGLMLSFSWFKSWAFEGKGLPETPAALAELNGFLKIAENGIVTIMSPNPEGGQNVKTSMPMIVAEELDADWKNVIVEQAHLNTKLYSRQFIGGSLAIRTTWKILRTAGATARQMLREAAAKEWNVPLEEITTKAGVLYHAKSGRSAGYGKLASAAAQIPVPKDVKLKDKKDFTIIGTSQKNVDVPKIISGETALCYGYSARRHAHRHDRTSAGFWYETKIYR
jgi:CO/xanthine dehydrogenase Mo-binding subunit